MSLFPTTCYRGNADGTFTKISHEQYWAETMAAIAEALAEEPEPAKPKTLKEIMAEQEAEAKKAKKKR